ncbi:hypothetical protein FYC62_05870 [Pedobacter aquae]|uniref:Uncharacterized protein n=1 Tax=Pedobacter aquae TaxID=2605747 RepID=A0A5C0VJ73_9SPHI|nr:hypothetical protein FYC62_05870 [Pedobacter aquae]
MIKDYQNIERISTANSTYPKVAVQWLNQALCIYQSFCLVDSEVLRNRHLRVAANRYKTILNNSNKMSD